MTGGRASMYIAEWKELPRWDLKSARAAAFRARHPNFRPFGDFIEEATELVHTTQEPEHEWPVYGVNNREGVTFSHFQKGALFNAPYKRIREDWFFHNPTRANVGSLGRVPRVEPDAITSPEYQVWKIKQGLIPDFVDILIRLPFFLSLIECHRVGAVKERLFVENLREIPIPVLDESQQRDVVMRWRNAQERIRETHDRVERHRTDIDSRFLLSLGIEASAPQPLNSAFAVSWEDLDRWGTGFNLLRQTAAELSSAKYSSVDLGAILENVQYGTSEKANTAGQGVPVLRMNNIVDGLLDFAHVKHVLLPEAEVERLLLRDGDILFNRTNSKELVGKCAVFHGQGRYVFASYLIRAQASPAKGDPDFIAQVVNSSIGREQINALSRQIIGQANVNSEELRSLRIPLPPLNVQKEITGEVCEARQMIARERDAAAELSQRIVRQIEALVLNT